MKKYLSLILALVLALAMAIPAFAATESVVDEKTGAGSSEQDITAKYEEGKEKTDPTDVATVYYVTVEWSVTSDLKYYDGTTTYTWNAEETKYEKVDPVDDGWSGTATVEITVTNQSNAEVTATADWATAAEIEAECEFTGNAVAVKSAADGVEVADGEAGEAQVAKINAAIDTPTEGTIDEDDAKVGTITVTIAAKG